MSSLAWARPQLCPICKESHDLISAMAAPLAPIVNVPKAELRARRYRCPKTGDELELWISTGGPSWWWEVK